MSELEPWFIKLMLLLRSKSETSAEEIRLSLEECIRQKHGNKKLLKPIPTVGGGKKSEVKPETAVEFPGTVCDLDSGSSSSKSEDLAMELLEEDLTCKVCRDIAIGLGNRLVECAECHSLFHQECHSPPIADSEVSDPRLVWYCAPCSKSISKPKASTAPKPSKPAARSGQGSPVAAKPFGGHSSQASTSKKLSAKHSSTKNLAPNINIIFADKRIQNMKKKAAKKQEKRGSN